MTNVGWQTFYGTIPLIVVLLGTWFNNQLLLKDLLARMGRLETEMKELKTEFGKIKERIIALELRAGIIYKN